MSNNPAQALAQQQMAQYAQQQFNQTYNAYAQQGMMQALAATQQGMNQQLANQAQIYHLGSNTHHMWVWNGLPMDIVDFARHAYGDTPEATHFILKYKETV